MADVYKNLSNQFPDITAMTSSALVSGNIPLTTLKEQANTLQTNLNNIQGQSNTLLTHQDSVNTIVTNEQSRLEQKKQSVDNAYSSQQRAVYMNDNVQKRYNAYSKILVAIVIGGAVLLALTFLQSYVPFIPSSVFMISYIIIISTVAIYSIAVYIEIQRHERLDYDRLYVKPLSDSSGMLDYSSSEISYNIPEMAICGSGTTLVLGDLTKSPFEDLYYNHCIPTTQGFQNMSGLGNINQEEFTNYSKYE